MTGTCPLAWQLCSTAAADPAAVAVLEGDRGTTYGELMARARGVAAALTARGAGTGVVAVAAPRGLDGIAAMVGVLLAGGTYLPLDPAQPPARRQEVLADARAGLVLAASGEREAVGDGSGVEVLGLADIPAEGLGGDILPSASAPAYLVYTSGSTGRPKGIRMGREALWGLIEWHLAQRGEPGRRTAQFAAVGFDVAVQEVLATLCGGGTLVVVDDETRRDPERVVGQLVAAGVHRLFLPTAALHRIAEAGLPRAAELALEEVVCAGEQLLVGAVEREFFARSGARLENHYGPAETHVVTVAQLPADPAAWPDRPGIGHPLPGVVLRTVPVEGAEDGAGELWVGGPRLADGYLDRPAETAQRFVTEDGVRWYRTGDLARPGPDGWEYLGRVDGQLKVSGYRVEPAEVEECLLGHPDVAEVAVDAPTAPGMTGAAALRAHVGLLRPRPVGELRQELRQLAGARLPAYLVIGSVRVVDRLPLTVNGKVDRAALAAVPAELPAPLDVPGGTDDVAGLLGRLLAARLGLAEVAPDENFFDLGATSLVVAEVRAALVDRLDRRIPISLFYAEPTVSRLAAALESGEVPADDGPEDGAGDDGMGDRADDRRSELRAARSNRRAERRQGRQR